VADPGLWRTTRACGGPGLRLPTEQDNSKKFMARGALRKTRDTSTPWRGLKYPASCFRAWPRCAPWPPWSDNSKKWRSRRRGLAERRRVTLMPW